MKKPFKASVIAVILVLGYFLGLISGLYAICYMPGGWKRVDLEYYAKQQIIEYTDKGRVSNWRNGGMAVVIYDANSKFQDFFRMNGDQFSINFVDQSEEALPEVLSGKSTMQLFPFVKNYSKLGYTSFLYVGLPIVTDGEVTGAFFWVKELPDLAETMIGYVVVFTVFFAIIAVVLLYSMHIQERYETAQRKYIDNITHEMKSPVASIKALAEALTDGMGKDENQRNIYYGMIIGEANRQEHMILDALTLAKLQTRKVHPPRQPIPAESFFAPICRKQDKLCELAGVSFLVADSVRDLPTLYSDADMLRKVLEILLGNARKFVQEGGTVSLSATVQRKRVTICVEDDGVGIPRSDLPYVFERFYKGSQSCNETGSGLGLAIAKETLAALKEKIWIRSEENKGTSVYFTVSRA
ncbi:MAG: sensor histidine kinase [Oscillospiraceae bacterium]